MISQIGTALSISFAVNQNVIGNSHNSETFVKLFHLFTRQFIMKPFYFGNHLEILEMVG